MDNLFANATPLLIFLLPGFLAAWILYGLASHPKPSQFERTVEALVFTFIIHVATRSVREIMLWIGEWWDFAGEWGQLAELIWPVAFAIVLGSGLAYLINRDYFHSCMRRLGFTSRTSHPSEWFCVFSSRAAFVILNFHDGRRLIGWPKEWPMSPSSGQFYIQKPAWIREDGVLIDLSTVDGILVQATDVRWVEVFPEESEDNDERDQGDKSAPASQE